MIKGVLRGVVSENFKAKVGAKIFKKAFDFAMDKIEFYANKILETKLDFDGDGKVSAPDVPADSQTKVIQVQSQKADVPKV